MFARFFNANLKNVHFRTTLMQYEIAKDVFDWNFLYIRTENNYNLLFVYLEVHNLVVYVD